MAGECYRVIHAQKRKQRTVELIVRNISTAVRNTIVKRHRQIADTSERQCTVFVPRLHFSYHVIPVI